MKKLLSVLFLIAVLFSCSDDEPAINWVELNIPDSFATTYPLGYGVLGSNYKNEIICDGSKLFKIKNHGNIFESIDEGLTQSGLISINRNNKMVIAGGSHICFNNDDGNNWTKIYDDASETIVTDVLITDNNDVFICKFSVEDEQFYIYGSTDLGKTWGKKMNGVSSAFKDNHFWVSKFYYSTDGKIYFGTSKGSIYVSDDRGEPWEKFIETNVGGILTIEFDDSNEEMIIGSGEIYKINIINKTLTKSSSGFEEESCRDIKRQNGVYYARGYTGIYESKNSGESWSKIFEGNMQDNTLKSMAVDNDNYIFVANNRGKLFRIDAR